MMENRQSSCQTNYRMPANQNAGTMSRPTAASPAQKPCRRDLMNKIDQYSFAMNEANLFLINEAGGVGQGSHQCFP